MKRNELSNVAFYVQSVGEVVILAVIVGVLFGVDVNRSAERNNYGLSVLIAFATGVWLLLAIPWFVLEKRRPGQDPGMNIVIAGLWQLTRAMKEIWQLRQSLFYLIGEFPAPREHMPECTANPLHRQATSFSATPSTRP